MKKKKILDAIGQIDDRFIEEASPENAKEIIREAKREKREKRRWIRYGVWATVGALVIALNLWLFIPFSVTPPSVAEYSSSQYYSVIEKINQANFVKPKYKNNFVKLIKGGFFPFKATDIGGSENQNEYVETTDNQVEGIIEADLVKRTETHAFYLNRDTVLVYSLSRENSSLVASYKIEIDCLYVGAYGEMFLSQDGKRLTVILPYYYSAYEKTAFEVVSLNVENPNNVTEIARLTLYSTYKTSRSVDGDLLIISDYAVRKNVDFEKREEYIPSIKQNGKQIFVTQEDIISPDVLTSSFYTVVCKIDEQTLNVEGFTAFLSYTQAVYVSNDFVYVGRAFTEELVINKRNSLYVSKTEIIPISYRGEELEIKDSVIIDGQINDQYSLDEFEGRLRVVTTTSEREGYSNGYTERVKSSKTNASLFVVDLSNMQTVASVIKFAPDGESVRSARFDKNNVYVCTSIQLTDPVFFFDLTDLSDIKIKDTGTIAGFSTSLVNFGDGYLLGIGVGESVSDLKIEVYAEGEDSVVSVCKYQDTVGYSQSYKSYYINRDLGLVGLAVWQRQGGEVSYLLLEFNGEELTEVLNIPLQSKNTYFARLILTDGHAYVFCQNEFVAVEI